MKNPFTYSGIFLIIFGFSSCIISILDEYLGRVSNHVFTSPEVNFMIGICGIALYFLSKR